MAGVLGQFRPTLWSSNLIVDIDEQFVGAGLTNRDYAGEITAKGNVLKINEIGDITVSDYTEDVDMTIAQLTGAQKELVIDQAKSFSFGVDDVLVHQASGNLMSAAMAKAGHAIAKVVDTHIAANYSDAGVVTSGIGTSGTDLDVYATHLTAASNIIGLFTNMNRYAGEANMPDQRWFWIPPWLHSYMIYAGIIDNTAKGSSKLSPPGYGNGFRGSYMGFDLYVSNNVNNDGTTWNCMFGSMDAIAFAGQIIKMETGRREKQFGDLVKGLYVYGSKVVRPDHLGVAYLAAGGLST